MRLSIVKNTTQESPPSNHYDFTPPGGTIGRSKDNNLVLPDNDRAISRLQAIIHVTQNGDYSITNRGSVVPITLNNTPIERGIPHSLKDGDLVDIAGYQLQVSAPSQSITQSTANNSLRTPSAHSSDEKPQGIPNEIWDKIESEFVNSATFTTKTRTISAEDHHDHPLLQAQEHYPNTDDPLTQLQETIDLHQLVNPTSDPDKIFDTTDTMVRQRITADTTPTVLLSPEKSSAVLSVHHRTTTDYIPITPQQLDWSEYQANNNQNQPVDIISLFADSDLDAVALSESLDDPLQGLLSNAIPLTTSMEDISSTAAPEYNQQIFNQPIPAEREHNPSLSILEMLNATHNYVPPALAEPEPSPAAASFHATTLSELNIAESVALATEESLDELTTPPLDIASLAQYQATQKTALDSAPVVAPVPQQQRLNIEPNPQKSSVHLPAMTGEQLPEKLLDALLAGMGLDDVTAKPTLSTDQLYLIGRLLSLFSQGTVALLSSRTMLKRGVKAEMTMILEEANNPFKLLPTGKTVLMQMFCTPMPGFVTPENAVRGALIDLQAHQLGMIAGIRAIIAAMLQSFNPERLAQEAASKLAQKKSTFSVRNNKKAALWEHFVEHYQLVSGEVEDDFHTLFGEVFLRAYDIEVEQYKESQVKGS